MSRSGYCDDWDVSEWQGIMARGAIVSAIRGRRGQRFFRELLAALDAMPEKRLIANELVEQDGSVCALGALGKARGLSLDGVDPEDPDRVAGLFDIAASLAREVVYENDEAGWYDEKPEARWVRMRNWVRSQIREV